MSEADVGGVHPQRVEALSRRLETLESEQETLEEELAAKDEQIAALEQRVEQLDKRTDLLQLIQNSDEMTGQQRSATLLQHLRRAAESSDGNSDDPTSSRQAAVTREQAEIALQHPDVDRTTIYDDMRRAVRLVDDEDVCWYDSDGSPSRLHLDLEAGELPAQFQRGEQ